MEPLSIMVGAELDQGSFSKIEQQIRSLGAGKENKIEFKAIADFSKIRNELKNLQSSMQSGRPLKINVDVNRGLSNSNIKSYLDSISAKPVKITLAVDQKATNANIQNAIQNAQNLSKQSAQNAAANKSTGTSTGLSNVPAAADIDKFTRSLNDAVARWQDAFGDKNAKLSGFNIIHDSLDDSYRAAVQFNNAIGETTSVMFRLQDVLDANGQATGFQEWVATTEKFTASFKNSDKEIESTLNKLQGFQKALDTIQSKGFERSNQLSGTFADPVVNGIDSIQQKIDQFQSNAKNNGITMTTDQIRDLQTELTKLDLLRVKQQNTQYQARQLSATDVSSQANILKSNLAVLQNQLKDTGIFDRYKDRIDALRTSLKTLGQDGGTTVPQWQSQWKELMADINSFKASYRGQGVMEAFNISGDQLEKIKGINKILSGQDNTQGVQNLKQKVSELAEAYKNLQTQMQSGHIGRDRLTSLQRQEKELDAQLRTYQTMAKALNGDVKSQQWVSQQEAGIAKLKADFAEYAKEMSNAAQLTPELQQRMEQLGTALGQSGTVDVTNLKDYQAQFAELVANVREYQSTLQGQASQLSFNIDTNQLAEIRRVLSFDGMQANTDGITALRENLNQLATEYQNIQTQLTSGNLTQDQFTQLSDKLKELDAQLKQATQTASHFAEGFNNQQWLDNMQVKIEKLRDTLERYKQQYADMGKADPTKASDDIENRIRALETALQGVDAVNFSNVNGQMQELGTRMRSNQTTAQSLSSILSQSFGGVGSYLARFTSAYYIINKIVTSFKKMVSEVRELDTSMVELTKVTDLQGSSLSAFVDNAYEVGATLGRTGKDVIDATTTFSRAGYDLQDSLELSKAALTMTNVGVDIPDMQTAASDMISIMKAYKIEAEDSMDVIDKLYNVSNKQPLDFGNITDMLVTAGGTLAQTNTSLEETMGLLTGAFATLRDTSVSNG